MFGWPLLGICHCKFSEPSISFENPLFNFNPKILISDSIKINYHYIQLVFKNNQVQNWQGTKTGLLSCSIHLSLLETIKWHCHNISLDSIHT